MNGKPYTEEEFEYIRVAVGAIKNPYDHHTMTCLAESLGRTESSIRGMIYRLKMDGKIKTGREYKPYTFSELKFIKESYRYLSNGQIAIRLGRSRKAIEHAIAKIREEEEMRNEDT